MQISVYPGEEHINTTKGSPRLCITNQVRLLPEPLPPPHSSLCHPHPNINIHRAAGPWRAEYIEPERRCRRGGEGADKGWWKKVEWVGGWMVAVKVVQRCAKGKVSNQTITFLFVIEYKL